MDLPRRLALPAALTGELWLASMPGRFEPLEDLVDWATRQGIDLVVSLAPDDEIAKKSPHYHAARTNGTFPFPIRTCPIADFDAPENRGQFTALVEHVLGELRQGARILVHCAAGIGRTGTFATAVLARSGMNLPTALEWVEQAGSQPETKAQHDFLREIGTTSRR